MIKFLDGPVAGKELWLRRAPIYLRVVTHGEVLDALDQLGDKPTPSETIHVYRLKGKASWIHLLVRGKEAKHRGGFFATGEYEFVDPQPAEEIMRSTDRWREWATEQHHKSKR